MASKTIIHVNQHRIKSNEKKDQREPVLTIKAGRSNTYAHEAVILGPDGVEVARVVYRPHKPLSCGARVWIETRGRVIPLVLTDGCEDPRTSGCAAPVLPGTPG